MFQGRRVGSQDPPGLFISAADGSLTQLLDRIFWLGLLPSCMPRQEPAAGSGGRAWRRRLLGLDLPAVSANLREGVRYAPLRALSSSDPFHHSFETGEQVVMELFRSGIVLAVPPPPAWAMAALARGPAPEMAWLARRPRQAPVATGDPGGHMGGDGRW